jgi:hypothetical protein
MNPKRARFKVQRFRQMVQKLLGCIMALSTETSYRKAEELEHSATERFSTVLGVQACRMELDARCMRMEQCKLQHFSCCTFENSEHTYLYCDNTTYIDFDADTLASTKTVRRKAKANAPIQMDPYIKARIAAVSRVDMERALGKMEMFIRESTRMTECMAMECFSGLRAMFTPVNSPMIGDMVKGHWCMGTESVRWDNGTAASSSRRQRGRSCPELRRL